MSDDENLNKQNNGKISKNYKEQGEALLKSIKEQLDDKYNEEKSKRRRKRIGRLKRDDCYTSDLSYITTRLAELSQIKNRMYKELTKIDKVLVESDIEWTALKRLSNPYVPKETTQNINLPEFMEPKQEVSLDLNLYTQNVDDIEYDSE